LRNSLPAVISNPAFGTATMCTCGAHVTRLGSRCQAVQLYLCFTRRHLRRRHSRLSRYRHGRRCRRRHHHRHGRVATVTGAVTPPPSLRLPPPSSHRRRVCAAAANSAVAVAVENRVSLDLEFDLAALTRACAVDWSHVLARRAYGGRRQLALSSPPQHGRKVWGTSQHTQKSARPPARVWYHARTRRCP